MPDYRDMPISGSTTLTVRGAKGRWASWEADPALRLRYLEVYRAVKVLRLKVPRVARAFGLKSRSQVYRIVEAVETSGILAR